ncbi:hypothetical protein FOA52_012712 [Chlamydomonas sp. UWO 241]|nr:hypothetical protein FOA52_012712 [Chlamydomonas sp. UWO 241]
MCGTSDASLPFRDTGNSTCSRSGMGHMPCTSTIISMLLLRPPIMPIGLSLCRTPCTGRSHQPFASRKSDCVGYLSLSAPPAMAAVARLTEERKHFRKNRPLGFQAKPASRPDGSVNLMEWSCLVPGKDKTLCEGAKFPCTIIFSADYPAKPPRVNMPKGFFHVNVCDQSGAVCLSTLKEVVPEHLGQVPGWAPSITVTQILLSLQELLSVPNFGSILGMRAYEVKQKKGQAEYDRRTREQALKYAQEDDELA